MVCVCLWFPLTWCFPFSFIRVKHWSSVTWTRTWSRNWRSFVSGRRRIMRPSLVSIAVEAGQRVCSLVQTGSQRRTMSTWCTWGFSSFCLCAVNMLGLRNQDKTIPVFEKPGYAKSRTKKETAKVWCMYKVFPGFWQLLINCTSANSVKYHTEKQTIAHPVTFLP